MPSKTKNNAKKLVLPTSIPWDSLKGRNLEECVYWLLDAMGAKHLDWRLGGTNGGAADGGRDLECTFHTPDPMGEIVAQRWWVEAKGRKGSVSPMEIKESILTAQAKTHVDVHLIVTNQQFTNPCKDWVAEWQKQNPRPAIRLWEKHDLERYVSRHPEVAIRLFPKALTDQGLMEVTSNRFWEYVVFADVPTLKRLWKNREEVEWDSRSWLSVLVGECANGSLAARPWASIMTTPEAVMCFLNSLANILYLVHRTRSAGVRSEPIEQALAHLLIHLIARLEPSIVAQFVERFTDLREDLSDLPEEAAKLIHKSYVVPIVNRALDAAGHACMNDCKRINRLCDKMTSEDAVAFWRQFRFIGEEEDKNDEKEDRYVVITNVNAACDVGIELADDVSCPFVDANISKSNWTELFASVRPALIARTGITPDDLGNGYAN